MYRSKVSAIVTSTRRLMLLALRKECLDDLLQGGHFVPQRMRKPDLALPQLSQCLRGGYLAAQVKHEVGSLGNATHILPVVPRQSHRTQSCLELTSDRLVTLFLSFLAQCVYHIIPCEIDVPADLPAEPFNVAAVAGQSVLAI
eukprot:TRINITY_DN1823_c1_g4_i1.p1 TRINITY_DN1823_c1_g4~~TRINITY_DN1823_c1_g4_i1.p1  ORF type:complete len:143 (+),score=8.31 TRINITY_DN1823_c1_g4_i1:408-836(+)